MIPDNRVSTHPGEILKYEFLEPLGQSQSGLAAHLGVPVQRINELIRGKGGVMPDTAWLFKKHTEIEHWLQTSGSELRTNKN